MMTPKELYDLNTKIYNEACDGTAELMRSHNCDCLDLVKYRKKVYIPLLDIYDEDADIFHPEEPTEIRLIPGHIEFSYGVFARGTTPIYNNETDQSSVKMLEVYNLVDTIFRAFPEDFKK